MALEYPSLTCLMLKTTDLQPMLMASVSMPLSLAHERKRKFKLPFSVIPPHPSDKVLLAAREIRWYTMDVTSVELYTLCVISTLY